MTKNQEIYNCNLNGKGLTQREIYTCFNGFCEKSPNGDCYIIENFSLDTPKNLVQIAAPKLKGLVKALREIDQETKTITSLDKIAQKSQTPTYCSREHANKYTAFRRGGLPCNPRIIS